MPTGRAGSATPRSTGSGSCCSRAWPRSTARRCRSRPPKWRCCGSSTPPSCPIPARCWRSWRAARRSPRRAPRGAGRAEEQGALLQAPASSTAFAELIETRGKAILAHQLRENYRLVDYGPPSLLLQQTGNVRRCKRLGGVPPHPARCDRRDLRREAGRSRCRTGPAQPTLARAGAGGRGGAEAGGARTPLVKAAFEAFPEAELAGFSLDEQRSA